jgi:hypothetical protein
MSLDVRVALGSTVRSLSDENYKQSFARYQFWLELAQSYSQLSSDLIFDTIWKQKNQLSSTDSFIYPTCPLILRFASDVESDPVLASHGAGLRSRLCTSVLKEFFNADLMIAYGRYSQGTDYFINANFIAHCANLGYMEEASIRNHILQSLISPSSLHDHQAGALIILFKIAGATFETYVDPLVLDRCFDLLGACRSRKKLIDVSEFR